MSYGPTRQRQSWIKQNWVGLVAALIAIAALLVALASCGAGFFDNPDGGGGSTGSGGSTGGGSVWAPSLQCERTGSHPPSPEGAQNEIWMHSLQEIKTRGDTCAITIPTGVEITEVNSPAGEARWGGESCDMGNPIDCHSMMRGPGTLVLTWQPDNDSNGALIRLSNRGTP
jgi:hypothetical protein